MPAAAYIQEIVLLVLYFTVIYIAWQIFKWLIKVCIKCSSHYPTIFRKLHDPTWEQDVVYLHQFRRSPIAPNISPFCLKVEAWLRANDIKYKVCETWLLRSNEGLLPFIEINGKQIADSQLILAYLQKHFNIEEGLTNEQKGIARAVDRMIECSSFYCLVYWKAFKNASNLADPSVSGIPLPVFITRAFAFLVSRIMGERLEAHGIGRHSEEDIISILRNDIEAVDRILGTNDFLLCEKPTTPDFAIFGHLATTYYLPYAQPIKDMLDVDFPRVKAYLHRMRFAFFPEWETEQQAPKETATAISEKQIL